MSYISKECFQKYPEVYGKYNDSEEEESQEETNEKQESIDNSTPSQIIPDTN